MLAPVILVDCGEPKMQRSVFNGPYTNAVTLSLMLLR